MGVSRNTVKEVIAQRGEPPPRAPVDPPADPQLLRTLYEQCQGRAQRVYEKLQEEHGIDLPYSSLTRWLRRLGLAHPPQPRCARVPDEPGAERQHDTSPYRVELAGQPVPLIASLLYLRYSKRRYLRFYRSFNRFKMKCFFHQALMHWGHSAPLGIIDNTNLALYDSPSYLTQNQNIIWLGPTGVGKTGLATSFLTHAIHQGKTGRYILFAQLITELDQSIADHPQAKVLKHYLAYDVLQIDELGYAEVEPAQVGLFFTLLQQRHKKKPTLITSNLGFEDWNTFLKNPSLTAALIDRLTENSHVFNLRECLSLRPKRPAEPA